MQNSIYCYMASEEQALADSASILPFHHLGNQRGLEAPLCSTALKQLLCTSCGPNFITLCKQRKHLKHSHWSNCTVIDSSLAAVSRCSAWAMDSLKMGGLLSLHRNSVAPAGFLLLCEVVSLILATQVFTATAA